MWVSGGGEPGGRVCLEFASGESGGLGLFDLGAEGHSAQADFGDAESGASRAAVVYSSDPAFCCARMGLFASIGIAYPPCCQ